VDGVNFLLRPFCGEFYRIQCENDPFFPTAVEGHFPQQVVILAPIFENIPAHVQNWGIQKSVLHQQEDVQYAARSAIAIGEWVYGFELVVRNRQSHERIDRFATVDEIFPIA
jgi:hypothetical protein